MAKIDNISRYQYPVPMSGPSRFLIPALLALLPVLAATGGARQVDKPEASRDRWQQPEKILDAVGVKPGMTIGEAGAGEGYFTFKLAERVGPTGKVYANDIKESSLDLIRRRMRSEKEAGFALVRLETFLARDTVYIFNPNPESGEKEKR